MSAAAKRITHNDDGTVYRDKDGVVVAWSRVLTEEEVKTLHDDSWPTLLWRDIQ